MIKIKTLSCNNSIVTFVIINQDAEDYTFFYPERKYKFDGKTIMVSSKKFPFCKKESETLYFYIRGKNFILDKAELKVTLTDYLLINEFLDFYNNDINKKILKGVEHDG